MGEGGGGDFMQRFVFHVPLQFGLDEYSGMLMRNDAACINKKNIFCMALLPLYTVCMTFLSLLPACVCVFALFDK